MYDVYISIEVASSITLLSSYEKLSTLEDDFWLYCPLCHLDNRKLHREI